MMTNEVLSEKEARTREFLRPQTRPEGWRTVSPERGDFRLLVLGSYVRTLMVTKELLDEGYKRVERIREER
jgi:hypothetical protein